MTVCAISVDIKGNTLFNHMQIVDAPLASCMLVHILETDSLLQFGVMEIIFVISAFIYVYVYIWDGWVA